MRYCGCSARVISYISSVRRTAPAAVPPTNPTMAGDAAMANPPSPTVSVIAESPMSGLASAAVNDAEEQPVDHRRRGREPGVPGAGEPDPELGAVAGHRRDQAGSGHAGGGVDRQLPGRHHQVEHEVVVAVDEPVDGGPIVERRAPLQEVGTDLPEEQRGRRPVAVVAVVAHLQRLGDEHLQVDRAVASGSPRAGSVRAPVPSSAAARSPRRRTPRSGAPCRAPR